ncbi:hypothetical protein DFS34DRAFT_7263 [Phlyctochytrium arcticum]|nr:hypothetical protein DFS34DRAFT_7263 [Phlyctochytrium arcticum]
MLPRPISWRKCFSFYNCFTHPKSLQKTTSLSKKREKESCLPSPPTSQVLESAATDLANVNVDAKLSPANAVNYARFAIHVAMRDRSCIVTGDSNPAHLVGTHIVPLSWSKRGLEGLPEDVRGTLASTRLGLDDISNGFLLSSQYYDTFDDGSWSVVFRWKENGQWAEYGDEFDLADFEEGEWVVVPITDDCPAEIIGKRLRVPKGARGDGGQWSFDFPPAALLWFHLKASVWKHCRGADGGEDMRRGGDKFDLRAYRALKNEHQFESDIDFSAMPLSN